MSMRNRFIALVAITLVVTVGWFGLVFNPGRGKLSEVRADVETTKAEVAQLTAKVAELQALKRNEKQLRAQAAKFEHALPNKPAISDFIRDVQDIAQVSEVDWASVSPGLPAGPQGGAAATSGASSTGLKVVGVSLNAKGGFFALERFIEEMETLARAARINTFSLSGTGDALSLSLQISIFLNQPAGAAASPAPATSPAPASGSS